MKVDFATSILFGETPAIEQKSATLLPSNLRRSRKGMSTTPLLPLPDELGIITIKCIDLTFRLSGIKDPQTLRKEAKSSKSRVSKSKESLCI
jgi:hypothetical protein